MPPEDVPGFKDASEILNTFSSPNRVYTFYKLDEKDPKYIAVDLDVTRNALQHYITDWKKLDLIERRNNSYDYTEKGEVVKQFLEQFFGEIAEI